VAAAAVSERAIEEQFHHFVSTPLAEFSPAEGALSKALDLVYTQH